MVRWKNGYLNSRLLDARNALLWTLALAKQRHIDTVAHLGDLAHPRDALLKPVLTVLRETMWEFKKANVKLIGVIGNHDYDEACLTHIYPAFEGLIHTSSVPQRSGIIGVVPYNADARSLVGSIQDIAKEKPQAILTHCALNGTPFRSGYVWGSSFAYEDVPADTMIFSGHFHDHSRPHPRFLYVGSMLQQNWGDEGVEKLAWIVDWKKRSIKSVSIPGPQFKTIGADERINAGLKGHFVRVLVPDTWPSKKRGQERERVRKLGARYVEIEPIPAKKASMVEAIAAASSVRDLTRSYAKRHGADARRIEVGLKLLDDAERENHGA